MVAPRRSSKFCTRPWPTVPRTPTLPTVTKPPPPPPFRRHRPCAAIDPPHLWRPASAHRSVLPLIVARLPWPPLPTSASPIARSPPTVPVLVRLRTSPDATSTCSSLGRLLRLLVAGPFACHQATSTCRSATSTPRHIARSPLSLDVSLPLLPRWHRPLLGLLSHLSSGCHRLPLNVPPDYPRPPLPGSTPPWAISDHRLDDSGRLHLARCHPCHLRPSRCCRHRPALSRLPSRREGAIFDLNLSECG
jgi:hypothetical protein